MVLKSFSLRTFNKLIMTTSLYPHTKSVFVQSVDLVVRNLEMVSRYYQDVIGLNLIEGGSKRHILGSDIPLLTLHW